MGVGAVVVLLSEGEIWVEILVKGGIVFRDPSKDLVGSDVPSEDLVGSDASLRNALI